MNLSIRTIAAAIITLASVQASCTIQLPIAITVPTVDQAFGGPTSNDPEIARLERIVLGDARSCAARLNSHRNHASKYNSIRVLVAGLGGLTSAAGGIVGAVTDESEQKRNASITSAIGGAVALAGTFAVNLLGDPTTSLKVHSDAVRSWDYARRMSLELPSERTQRIAAIREIDRALQDCMADRAPVSSHQIKGPEVE